MVRADWEKARAAAMVVGVSRPRRHDAGRPPGARRAKLGIEPVGDSCRLSVTHDNLREALMYVREEQETA
ncbi:MAG TPA: hypothetical protein VGB42_02780 [Candidatus Thermoplasmatota archaeon]